MSKGPGEFYKGVSLQRRGLKMEPGVHLCCPGGSVGEMKRSQHKSEREQLRQGKTKHVGSRMGLGQEGQKGQE